MASDTGLREKLSRDKSVTEPWITSPRNDTKVKSNPSGEEKSKMSENTAGDQNSSSNNTEGQSDLSVAKEGSILANGETNTEHRIQSPVVQNNEEGDQKVTDDNKIENTNTTEKGDNCEVETVTDEEFYDPELFISEEERKEFAFMIKQKKEEMITKKEQFEKWTDTLTRRRMFALSRMRKLGKYHGERFKFYGKVQNYVNKVEGVLNSTPVSSQSRTSTVKSRVQSTNLDSPSQTKSAVGANISKGTDSQPVDGMNREETGFVILDENRSGSNSRTKENEKLAKKLVMSDSAKEDSPVIVPVES